MGVSLLQHSQGKRASTPCARARTGPSVRQRPRLLGLLHALCTCWQRIAALTARCLSLPLSLACLLARRLGALALRLCRVWSVGVRHAGDRQCEVQVYSPLMPIMSPPRLPRSCRSPLCSVTPRCVPDRCRGMSGTAVRSLSMGSPFSTSLQHDTSSVSNSRSPGARAVTFAGSPFQLATPRPTCCGLWFRLLLLVSTSPRNEARGKGTEE